MDKYKELAPVYNELAHLLFMYQIAFLNKESVNISSLKIEIDRQIALIHAHNIIDITTNC